MKDAVEKEFEAVSLEIVEALRLDNNLSALLFDRLRDAMNKIVEKYRARTSMPKYLYYCIQALRDNVIGKLNSSTGAERQFFAEVSSYIDQTVEDLLLSE